MKVHYYKTYRFINKDPIIDVLRTAMQDEKISKREIAEISGITVATLDAWFKGGTKRPQNASTLAVTVAIGPRAKRMLANYILGLGEEKVIPFRQRTGTH